MEIDNFDQLFELCQQAGQSTASSSLLNALAASGYVVGDINGEDEYVLNDEAFLTDLFQSFPHLYEQFGAIRSDFPDGFPLLRVLAAAHPNTAPGTLEELSNDESPEVLWAVSSNPITPSGVLDALVSKATNCTIDYLWGYRTPEVNSHGGWQYGSEFGDNVIELGPVTLLAALAANPATSDATLQLCLESGNTDVCIAALKGNGERLTAQQWEVFAGDEELRAWVLINPARPDELGKRLVALDARMEAFVRESH